MAVTGLGRQGCPELPDRSAAEARAGEASIAQPRIQRVEPDGAIATGAVDLDLEAERGDVGEGDDGKFEQHAWT
jgi:hypothetical protein